MSADTSPKKAFKTPWLERFGAGLGIACAIHCLLTPLLVGFLPLVGLSFLASEAAEFWLLGFVLVTAIGGALWGFRKHRELRVLMSFIGACALMICGVILGEEALMGRILLIAGGILVAIAHLVSARLCRQHHAHHDCGSC